MKRLISPLHLIVTLICIAPVSAWALPEKIIEIRNHLFYPQTLIIPAGKKVKITFVNYDPTPEEIDSFDMNREKVIFGNSRGSIYVGPLPPGDYGFFGEYHPNTAIGTVRVIRETRDAD